LTKKKRVFAIVPSKEQITEDELNKVLLGEAKRHLEKRVLHTLDGQIHRKGVISQEIFRKADKKIDELKEI